jgi:hypothetical protein
VVGSSWFQENTCDRLCCVWQVKVPEEDEFIEDRRFMVCCWGPGDPATVMVMLDRHGQLVDLLHCSQLSGIIRRPPRNMQLLGGRYGEGAYNMFNDPQKVSLRAPHTANVSRDVACICGTLSCFY